MSTNQNLWITAKNSLQNEIVSSYQIFDML